MSLLQQIAGGLRGLFHKEHVERELDEELRGYVEAAAAAKTKAGMSAEEARRAARLELGGVEAVKEEVRAGGWESWLEALLQDLRFGARLLRKSPGFTIVAVLTLALGIGANTAIFSVVNAALLRPLPFEHPDRLVAVQKIGNNSHEVSISYLDFLDWQENNHTFEAMAAWRDENVNLTGTDEAERLTGKMVSSTFFPALNIQPILGRDFSSAEDRLGSAPVALISERIWKSRYAASANIVGHSMILNGKNYIVIGVIPSIFRFPRSREAIARTDVDDIFTPIGQ